MLETEIKKLTAAMEALNATILSGGLRAGTAPPDMSPVPPATTAGQTPLPNQGAQTLPPVTSPPPAATNVAPFPQPPAAQLTPDQVNKALVDVSLQLGESGGGQIMAILQNYNGAISVPQLRPEDYAAVVADAQALVGGA